MDADVIRQWLAALDSISYYELFRISPDVTADGVRNAFHAFAESFHPDLHHWRPSREQAALGYIFKRGTEAYRVLSDLELRRRYDEALAKGILRPESLVVELDGPRARSLAPAGSGRLVDHVRSPGARPFVVRVEELVKKGDTQQAKLQLVMAMHLDANNPALEAYAKELEEAIKAKAEDAKKSGKK
jgi:curved DNA-binding protein CbpA